MKGKVLTVFMYVALALVAVAGGAHWASLIFFNDMVNLYHGGILIYIYIFLHSFCGNWIADFKI